MSIGSPEKQSEDGSDVLCTSGAGSRELGKTIELLSVMTALRCLQEHNKGCGR